MDAHNLFSFTNYSYGRNSYNVFMLINEHKGWKWSSKNLILVELCLEKPFLCLYLWTNVCYFYITYIDSCALLGRLFLIPMAANTLISVFEKIQVCHNLILELLYELSNDFFFSMSSVEIGISEWNCLILVKTLWCVLYVQITVFLIQIWSSVVL